MSINTMVYCFQMIEDDENVEILLEWINYKDHN